MLIPLQATQIDVQVKSANPKRYPRCWILSQTLTGPLVFQVATIQESKSSQSQPDVQQPRLSHMSEQRTCILG